MALNNELQQTLDDLQELLEDNSYQIEGFGVVLLVKNKKDKTSGYIINYEAIEFLKLIACFDIARYRVIQSAEDNTSNGFNEFSEDELDLRKIDPLSDAKN